jgi:membrane protease YdiL (CAAX protease family)
MIATGLIWATWHYPWILASDQSPYSKAVWLAFFTVAVTNASVFFGWLRLRTGDTWAPTVGHGANNMTEDQWHRVAFTGEASGRPTMGADAVLIVAEVIVLLGIVTVSGLRRPHRTALIPARA